MVAILGRLLELAGGVTEKQVAKIFDWGDERARHAIAHLEAKRGIVRADGLLVLPRLG